MEAHNVLRIFKKQCLQKFITGEENPDEIKTACKKFLEDDKKNEVASKMRMLIPICNSSLEKFISGWEYTYTQVSKISNRCTDYFQAHNRSRNIDVFI